MPILLALALAEQVLRLVNNLLEGTPVEVRRAQAIMWFELTVSLLPADHQPRMREALAKLKEGEG
jgi:hypothetical protein